MNLSFVKQHKHKISYSILSFFILLLLLPSQCYRLKTKETISDTQKEQLIQLGKLALFSNDVPVSAILVYQDSIIGKGYNTVKKDHNLSGHAEINAMNMAYSNYGEDFFKLNRDELLLYTTFEPCAMCKGALIEFNIQKVYFERSKPLGSQLKNSWKAFWFELGKERFDAEELQERLFEMHPDYDMENE